jgi:hypothetical protein
MRGRAEFEQLMGDGGGWNVGLSFAFFSFMMHLKRVMSTHWDFDCILFTAFILIGDKEVF